MDVMVLVNTAAEQLQTVSIPDVRPDFSAPFFVALQRLVSWFLAATALLAIVALAYCLIGVIFQGLGNQSYQQSAAANLLRVVVGVILLASSSAIVGFFWGFDLGLS
ncbi:MAG: hypothetical protein LH624_05615 [Cryobacterium sp.]|nr:hypothetical protein [Cryobacterium sp.]